MTVVDKIASLARTLPKEAQEQVLDFVGFLVSKYDAETPSEDEAWDQVESHVSPGRQQPGR